ncbi:hypothetical protein WKI68_04685 [Streptomyces sp. MS1.HAVA.3]|uniref:DUF6923 domain-containing protein n=1 Tax=Streptomyces caledonius TaxID=3134107 RepID=A0ABU8TZC1_9ACTN
MIRGTNRPNHGKRRLRALSALGAVGIVAGLASSLPASPAGAVAAPAAAVAQRHADGNGVSCRGQVYVSFGEPDQLYTAQRGPGTVQFTPLGDPTPFLYNAIGVNPRDRFLYGTTFGGAENELVRFDGKGGFTNLGAITGLPSALYISGTFDNEGNYYILADDTGRSIGSTSPPARSRVSSTSRSWPTRHSTSSTSRSATDSCGARPTRAPSRGSTSPTRAWTSSRVFFRG